MLLGFISQDDLLIRLDIFNEFEKYFLKEKIEVLSHPMDLSNLLGIKKDKLISILKIDLLIYKRCPNDLVISKRLKITKQLN